MLAKPLANKRLDVDSDALQPKNKTNRRTWAVTAAAMQTGHTMKTEDFF